MIEKLIDAFRSYRHDRYIKSLQQRGLKLGQNVSIVDSCFWDAAHCSLISIGNNCTIAPLVSFLAHDASMCRLLGYTKIGAVNIGNDCFIGLGSIIMPGVTLGDKVIVGAGSVVTKSFEAGMVIAGNPAKAICSTEEYLIKIESKMEDFGGEPLGTEYNTYNINEDRLKRLHELTRRGPVFMK